ncbi:MAG: hypothetical protein V4494_04935 [Chlamydiota bacterium]
MKRDLVNKVWVLLVFITAGITLWFSVLALMGVWNYLKLEAKTVAIVDVFKVEEENPSRYVISGHYSYRVNGQIYEGETLFDRVHYLNRPAAEKDLEKWEKMSWEAWYNPKDPKQSSLQKMFPFKKCLYALLTLGVFIYFLILRYFTFSKSRWKNDV